MYYVYILRGKGGCKIYIGFTNDIERRVKEHNTESKEWELVYYEAYRSKDDALLREKRLKYYGRALGQLKRRIKKSLFPYEV